MAPLTWGSVPASVRSYVISTLFGFQTALTTCIIVGYSLGYCKTFSDTLTYLSSTWWSIVLAGLFGVGPFYRAKQGSTAAANTISLVGGGTAVITPPSPPKGA